MTVQETVTLKVAGGSNVKGLAGSIAKCIEEGKNVELLSIGASAVNQAVKGVALARGYLASNGRDLYLAPGFDNVMLPCVNGVQEERTAIRFILKII